MPSTPTRRRSSLENDRANRIKNKQVFRRRISIANYPPPSGMGCVGDAIWVRIQISHFPAKHEGRFSEGLCFVYSLLECESSLGMCVWFYLIYFSNWNRSVAAQ